MWLTDIHDTIRSICVFVPLAFHSPACQICAGSCLVLAPSGSERLKGGSACCSCKCPEQNISIRSGPPGSLPFARFEIIRLQRLSDQLKCHRNGDVAHVMQTVEHIETLHSLARDASTSLHFRPYRASLELCHQKSKPPHPVRYTSADWAMCGAQDCLMARGCASSAPGCSSC